MVTCAELVALYFIGFVKERGIEILKDIKIFVSHRIDLDSEIVETPIYVPVRCGAIYDKNQSSSIIGDDTGENISQLRMSFCEFTVQYWAWKNCDADYYGLCHYRRYLSFSDKHYKTKDINNVVREPRLTAHEKKKYGFTNTEYIHSVVENYDIIIPEPVAASKMSYCGIPVTSVKQMWETYNNIYFKQGTIEKVFNLIKQYFPQYYKSACDYFDSEGHRAFNCYIMKKELFFRMCDFEFKIMMELSRQLKTDGSPDTMQRAVGYVGEMLNGIFIHHILTEEHCSAKQTQLVFFANPSRIGSKSEYYKIRILSTADKSIRKVADAIFPMYSPRREAIKKIIFKLTPLKPSANLQPVKDDKGDSSASDFLHTD